VTVGAVERAKTDPQAPYEHIAAQVRQDILSGWLPAEQPAPTEKLAAGHSVSPGTAHRATTLLKASGLVTAALVTAPWC
jgi:integrase